MSKARAYGADAVLLAVPEVTYGTAPTSGYAGLDFKSCTLSSEQPLGDDPLLGRGRNAQDPYRGLVTDEGEIEIPIDRQGVGFWLTALFGDPTTTTVKATGYIGFSAQPAANSTIALNGVTWTFKASGATGAQTNIGVDLDATITALASNLNASADTQVAKCTYTANTTDDRLEVEFDTAGTTGNAWLLVASAASNGTASYAHLTGGGYSHVWESGSESIPSYTIEVGHPALTTPVFFRHVGCVMESLAFNMGQEGPANATIVVVAQGEESAAATIDGTPDRYTLQRYSNGRGFVKRGGSLLGNITSGSFTFSNNLERVRVIRDDGKIEAADPTLATCNGTMTVRYDGAGLEVPAASGDPIVLQYGFTTVDGWSLTFDLPRVLLPKAKAGIAGPGGVEVSYDWRAAYDSATDKMLTVTLITDVASY